MNNALPVVHESAETLKELLGRERRREKQQRLHALYLLATGQARSRITVASLLGVSRGTVGRWLAAYAQGGLPALLDISIPAGKAPALSPDQRARLQAALERPEGFASYGAVQQWLADELGVQMRYHAVHKLVRYTLRAKLKVPRPVHIQKRQRRRPVSGGVRGPRAGRRTAS